MQLQTNLPVCIRPTRCRLIHHRAGQGFSQDVIPLFRFQQIGDFPCKVIADRFLEIGEFRRAVNRCSLIPVCAVFGVDCTLIVFALCKDTELLSAKTHKFDKLVITLSRMVGITEVDTRLLAVRTCITVVGEVGSMINVTETL